VVASNTSYLDVFSIAPEDILPRLAIAHFYAPPYLIPLVEVVGGEKTAADVVPCLISALNRMGQRPVTMRRFIPGYIVNRLQRAMGREIFYLLDNGYAGPEEIDAAVQASLGLRLPVLGVVRRYDFTGLDISLKFLENPYIHLAGEDTIPRSLKVCIDAGNLGVKTGQGFYSYGGRSTADILRERDHRLLALRRFMAKEKIALKF
jgi:3-hydroxybutyryl-CoA dehydrogenase